MTLTRTDYINYLINEGKRNQATKKSGFYKELYLFVNSEEGKSGFIIFKKLNPYRIGINRADHISTTIKRMFEL